MYENGNKYLTENKMAARICEREDNHYYKHTMIREILKMYAEEMRKALLDGERVNITGVGTIIPEIKLSEQRYSIPKLNKGEGTPPPFARLRISNNHKMRVAINNQLNKNLREGIYGLKEIRFSDEQIDFMIENGHITGEEGEENERL